MIAQRYGRQPWASPRSIESRRRRPRWRRTSRSALRAQAELQASAGAAAEAAVRAAEKSWIAARTAEAAEGRARIILGLMTRYLAVTIVLVVITIIFLAITASVAH